MTMYAGMALATLQGVEVPTKGVEAVGGGGSVAGLEAEGSGTGLEAVGGGGSVAGLEA